MTDMRLFDLRVTVERIEGRSVCGLEVGDYFELTESSRVRIPEGLGYNLTARTSFGRISSELPVTSTGSIGGDTLNGTIGSGGCQLQLTDSNGSIEIAKAP